jgi:hypothetical protein
MEAPLPEAAFDALMERAGLTGLTPAEREGIRLATRFVAGFAARVRAPAPLGTEVEPATVFVPGEPRR